MPGTVNDRPLSPYGQEVKIAVQVETDALMRHGSTAVTR